MFNNEETNCLSSHSAHQCVYVPALPPWTVRRFSRSIVGNGAGCWYRWINTGADRGIVDDRRADAAIGSAAIHLGESVSRDIGTEGVTGANNVSDFSNVNCRAFEMPEDFR